MSHLTWHDMTWHESLIVVFSWCNVIPRISAAFSSTVLALKLNGLELFEEKVINAQSPAAETELGALPSHLITSWSPMINGGGRAREQQNNDFVEKTGRCWYHPDPIYAELMVPAMSRAFNYRYNHQNMLQHTPSKLCLHILFFLYISDGHLSN